MKPPSLLLEATAFNREQLIFPEAPQVALAGRSNVGKSSLVNALAGRKQLAKTSAVPGKTRSINYYRIGGLPEDAPRFVVDLPGYGYARCSQTERVKWAALLDHYFTVTPGLRALIVLLDARLEPQASDQEMTAYARAKNIPLTPVLTKADKCNARELARCKCAWEKILGRSPLVTSTEKKTGIDEVWNALLMALGLTEVR